MTHFLLYHELCMFMLYTFGTPVIQYIVGPSGVLTILCMFIVRTSLLAVLSAPTGHFLVILYMLC